MHWFGQAMPQSALEALSEEEAGPAVEDKVARKALSALGHHLSLLEGAAQSLQTRVQKNKLSSIESAFLKRWLPRVGNSDLSTPFVVGLSQTGRRFRIHGMSQPELPLQLWALLRLPSLRRLWESSLRRAHLQHLIALGPDIWVVDTTPLPPGAVIAGLNLTSWKNLVTLRDVGRRFEIVGSSKNVILDESIDVKNWGATITEAIQAGDQCLVEHHTANAYWLAEYATVDGEICLTEARSAFSPQDTGGAWTVTRLDTQ